MGLMVGHQMRFGIHGRLSVTVVKPDGTIREKREGDNVMCTAGLSVLASSLVWSGIEDQATNQGVTQPTYLSPLYGAVGSGTGTVSPSDTLLFAELGREIVGAGAASPATSSLPAQVTWLFYFPSPPVTWVVTEAGVFANGSASDLNVQTAGTLMDHWVFTPSVTVPTTDTLILQASFSISGMWQMGTVAPDWLGATAGSPGLAGQVNQFTLDHPSVITYGETLASSQTTGSGVYDGSYANYTAQVITMGPSQTSLASVALQLNAVGGSPTVNTIPNLSISLYNGSSGAPSSSPLTTVTITETYVYLSSFWVSIPLTAGGLTPGTDYYIVTSMVGSSTKFYAWQHSNLAVGAFTSTDATSWLPVSYGMMFQAYQPGATGANVVQLISEDDGARTTQFAYDLNNQLVSLVQFTQTQGGSGSFLTSPTFTYTNGLISGVS